MFINKAIRSFLLVPILLFASSPAFAQVVDDDVANLFYASQDIKDVLTANNNIARTLLRNTRAFANGDPNQIIRDYTKHSTLTLNQTLALNGAAILEGSTAIKAGFLKLFRGDFPGGTETTITGVSIVGRVVFLTWLSGLRHRVGNTFIINGKHIVYQSIHIAEQF